MLWFSDVFRGYRKRPVARNGLISLKNNTIDDCAIEFNTYKERLVPKMCLFPKCASNIKQV